MTNRFIYTLFIIHLFVFSAFSQQIPVAGDAIVASDYSNANNWLALPVDAKIEKNADVFFVYPTAWRADGKYPLSTIDNTEMRFWAQYYLKTKASAFEAAGNIFAPYYRQFDAQFLIEHQKDGGDITKYYEGVPATDIIAAFDYYIKNYNSGRPFILVGHSQGSIMLTVILFEYLKQNPDVYKRMVAAYLIGVPITKQDYKNNPHIKPAQNADDIGVIISYNTESVRVDGYSPFANENNVLINPISWTTSTEHAKASQNLGSAVINSDWTLKKVMNLADAKIDRSRGTIICSTVDRETFSSPAASRKYIPLGSFHDNDIPLYYYNLQQNAQNRVEKYFLKNSKFQ
jgi:hypothetical protein